MSTLQQQIKEAVAAVGNNQIVEFRGRYSGRGMFGRTCIGIVGSMSECMLVVGQVVKEMADALAAVASETKDENYLCDTKMHFDRNVDILLNFELDSMGRQLILYWPSLEPI